MQGRFRGCAERAARGRRHLPGREGRRDGEMSFEVRPREAASGGRLGSDAGSHFRHSVMASLGSYLLLTAFVVCAYAAAISIAGARRRSRRLIESGVGAFYLM